MNKYNYRKVFIIFMFLLVLICLIVLFMNHKTINKKDHLYVTGDTKLKIDNSTPLSDEIAKKK